MPGPLELTASEAAGVLARETSQRREAGARLAASYVNFYIANRGIVMPLLDSKTDKLAAARAQARISRTQGGRRAGAGNPVRRRQHSLHYPAGAPMSQKAVPRRDIPDRLRIRPSSRIKLLDAEADRCFGWDKDKAMAATTENLARLEELQYKMYADGRFAMLIALQAIDGGGKDSTIRRVFGAFNPQGCTVTAFKAPSAEELRHDYLWRIHRHAPPRGEIAVFNRSHYEDVLIVRVNDLVPEDVWSRRYEQINQFEGLLGRLRHPRCKNFPADQQGGAAGAIPGAAHRQAQELEIRYRRSGEAATVDRLHAGIRGDVCQVFH